ncbi:hypothetical protein DFS34DRAFT_626406 [Phlyctochytrium arcticum]|nr:hypothetical protein DFS34DRAFT_626406 [Phlyctochytrium arcticum]
MNYIASLFAIFAILALALLPGTDSTFAARQKVYLARRQSSSSNDRNSGNNTRCAVEPYPGLGNRFRLGNCSTEYEKHIKICDSDKNCEKDAERLKTLCEDICQNDDNAVARCVKVCNRSYRNFDRSVCAPINGTKNKESCDFLAYQQLWACQEICVEFHKGLGNSSSTTTTDETEDTDGDE